MLVPAFSEGNLRRKPVRPAKIAFSPSWEQQLRDQGHEVIAGLDEAGRGCLFGPVVAAAVILPYPLPIRGIDDSKRLDAADRERLFERITSRCVAWSVGVVHAQLIDQVNILQASRLAMLLAVRNLAVQPDALVLDAVDIDSPLPQLPILHGDAVCRSIAAASILAKVYRDRSMREWERIYPAYGLGQNKGYGTEVHLDALRCFGPTPEHRFSFRPVREACLGANCLGWSVSQLELF